MALRTYFVETWGCQMNVLDSQRLAGLLEAAGLTPASNAESADVALLNTCSVRQKAVQKIVSRLGELRKARRDGGQPHLVGLCGCVAEQEGERFFKRASAPDFVLGTGRIGQLTEILAAAEGGQRRSVTGFAPTRDYDAHLITRPSSARQYVTAIHGCNQHCTFCVVPFTRGHEVSRNAADIKTEVEQLSARGAKEITLLGQTVNAYRCPESGADLGALLAALGEVPGLKRLQFLTSHPKYFTDKMIHAIASQPKLGTYLHVPFQSGSDHVLRRMHRGYTRAEYLDLVGRLRRAMPAITLSTDVIVGFPGETNDDFADTLAVIDGCRFGQLYGFVYSPRPGTPAARYTDGVDAATARSRLNRLFEVQARIQLELNSAHIGTGIEVLVDGPAKRGGQQWQGRGADNRVVNFPAWDGIAPGQIERLTVTAATPHALLAERQTKLLKTSTSA